MQDMRLSEKKRICGLTLKQTLSHVKLHLKRPSSSTHQTPKGSRQAIPLKGTLSHTQTYADKVSRLRDLHLGTKLTCVCVLSKKLLTRPGLQTGQINELIMRTLGVGLRVAPFVRPSGHQTTLRTPFILTRECIHQSRTDHSLRHSFSVSEGQQLLLLLLPLLAAAWPLVDISICTPPLTDARTHTQHVRNYDQRQLTSWSLWARSGTGAVTVLATAVCT